MQRTKSPTEIEQPPVLKPVDLSNPYDPRTKKYLQELQALIDDEILQYKVRVILEIYKRLERIRLETFIGESKQKLSERAIKAFWRRLQEEAIAASRGGIVKKESALKIILVGYQKRLSAELDQSRKMQKVLVNKHKACVVRVKKVNAAIKKQWNQRHQAANAVVVNQYRQAYQAAMNLPPEQRAGIELVRDLQGNVVTPEELEAKIEKTKSVDIEVKLEQRDFNAKLNQLLDQAITDAAKVGLSGLAREAGRAAQQAALASVEGRHLSVEDAESHQELKSKLAQTVVMMQVARGDEAWRHIRLLNELAGGDPTPTQLSAIVKQDKWLGKLLAKVSQPNLVEDADAMLRIISGLKEIESSKKEVKDIDEKIRETEERLNAIAAELYNIKENKDVLTSSVQSQGPGAKKNN